MASDIQYAQSPDERTRAELQWALLDALSSNRAYETTLARVREAPGMPYSGNTDQAAQDVERASALGSGSSEVETPVTRMAAQRVLEAASIGPLRGAFLARSLNALAQITAEISETALSEAVSAPTDYEALIRALDRAVATGRSPESVERDVLVEQARLRGVRARNRLLQAEGGTLSATQVATRLGITRQAVDSRRKNHKLLAVNTGKYGYAYPIWQFDEEGVLQGLDDVLRAISSLQPWSQVAFMLNRNARLGDQSPLDEVRRGHKEAVVQAASAYGNQGGA